MFLEGLFNVIAEKTLFPAISSDRSNEDISNLQLKGSPAPGPTISPPPLTPSHSQAAGGNPGAVKPRVLPAKPILKHRKPEPCPGSSGECGPGSASQRYYGDCNWYTNPMDSTYFRTNSSYHQV